MQSLINTARKHPFGAACAAIIVVLFGVIVFNLAGIAASAFK